MKTSITSRTWSFARRRVPRCRCWMLPTWSKPRRFDRSIDVTADAWSASRWTSSPQRAVNQVIRALRTEELPRLRQDFPGITWRFVGSDAEMRRATASLWGSFGLALAVIYSLLAIAFRGYIQPLIVLVAIPFGIVGAVLGHIVLGYDLSLVSFMGVIALSGVVINDSFIMIDLCQPPSRRPHGL